VLSRREAVSLHLKVICLIFSFEVKIPFIFKSLLRTLEHQSTSTLVSAWTTPRLKDPSSRARPRLKHGHLVLLPQSNPPISLNTSTKHHPLNLDPLLRRPQPQPQRQPQQHKLHQQNSPNQASHPSTAEILPTQWLWNATRNQVSVPTLPQVPSVHPANSTT